jgi:hypothetical protein
VRYAQAEAIARARNPSRPSFFELGMGSSVAMVSSQEFHGGMPGEIIAHSME